MPESPQTPRPPIEYESAAGAPGTSSPERRRLAKGLALGLVGGVALVVAAPLLGTFLDAKLHQGAELAGIGGLFMGAIVGGVLLLIVTIVAFVLGARRRSPMLRGVARGLLITIGLVGLTAGICAVTMQ